MACRFTWLSGLLFDEYRKRQTAEGFTWGTEVPSLSTVVLHHRPQQQQHNAQHRTDQAANGREGWGWGVGGLGGGVHDRSVPQEGSCARSGTEAFVPTGSGATNIHKGKGRGEGGGGGLWKQKLTQPYDNSNVLSCRVARYGSGGNSLVLITATPTP